MGPWSLVQGRNRRKSNQGNGNMDLKVSSKQGMRRSISVGAVATGKNEMPKSTGKNPSRHKGKC